MALAKTWERNFKRRVGRAPMEGERRRAEFFSTWKKQMPKEMYGAFIKLLGEEHDESFRHGRASVTGSFVLAVSIDGLIQRASLHKSLVEATIAAKAYFGSFDPESDDMKVYDVDGDLVWQYDPTSTDDRRVE